MVIVSQTTFSNTFSLIKCFNWKQNKQQKTQNSKNKQTKIMKNQFLESNWHASKISRIGQVMQVASYPWITGELAYCHVYLKHILVY